MKVIHLIDSGGFYGAEVVVNILIKEQIKNGLDVELLSIGEHGCEEKEIEARIKELGVKVKKYRMRKGLNIIGIIMILKYVKENEFDVIHSHGYKTNILLGLLPGKLTCIAMICTLHGWTNVKNISILKIYEWLESKLLNKFDALVVVNKNMLFHVNIIRSKVNKDKIHVINNAVDMEGNDSGIDHEMMKNICDNNYVIGAVGRLSEEKGYQYLLEAFSITRKSIKNSKLVFIGEGPQYDELNHMAKKLGIKQAVLFLGYKVNARNYFKYFDVFVLSSLTEGLPITLLESMNEGIPVIATRVGGIPDVIENGKNGILVEPKNPEEINNAIQALYNNDFYSSTLINNAKKTMKSGYSCNVMAEQYSNIYLNIVKH